MKSDFQKEIAEIKRVCEICIANPDYKKEISINPNILKKDYGIKLDLDEIEPIWNKNINREPDNFILLNKFYDFYKKEKSYFLNDMLNKSIINKQFGKWYKRQIKRTAMQFPRILNDYMAHLPYAIELTDGCSGNCWFCGLSAKPLKGIFRYTETNRKLYKSILLILKNIFGNAAKYGFCYFATDPFDNPDYEKFLHDFHKFFFKYPATTTSMALKDIKRTKDFLKNFSTNVPNQIRFTICSLNDLELLYKNFTPDELIYVTLILQNQESKLPFSNSGRCRKIPFEKKNLLNKEFNDGTTLNCVSGFIINLVKKEIKLISACVADDKYPEGYILFDKSEFNNLDEFVKIIEDMIEKYMPLKLRESDIVKFREDLEFEEFHNGFQVFTKFMKKKYINDPILKTIGKMIKKGNMSLQEICNSLEYFGISQEYIKNFINILFDDGVLSMKIESL